MSLLHREGKGMVAGCDEAGRGCLAGPVVAAAVILPPDYFHPILNDSKQLSERQREALRSEIEREAIAFAIGQCSPAEIDEMNILKCSFVAMHRALEQLHATPDFIQVDGNRFIKYREVAHETVVKGDAKFYAIAAASILAKTERDRIMEALHAEWPHYAWKKNKGYPTPEHRKGIALYGPCVHHRISFTLLPPQLKLPF